ncbi:MAG: S9 family peptidase [Candidatus Dormibacteraeota bacterium]|nr:S9 family peptidase [Candidatus Dormibacteraeota bacterium]
MKTAEKRRLTPELVAKFPRPGMAMPGRIRYAPDSKFVTYLFSAHGDLERELWRLDLSSGKKEHWLAPPGEAVTELNISRDEVLRRERQRLRETGITDYLWAEKATVMLLPLRGDLYQWKDGATAKLAGGGIIDPQITPDGRRVFFVRDGEVWCVDAGGERQLTSGASPGVVNGLAEFVAQEELDRQHGYWPSPSGDLVAFEQVDERHIPIYPIVHQGKPVLEVEEHRYPFAGMANARVKLGVVRASGGRPTFMDLGIEEGYIARVHWHPDGRLLVQWLSRDQRQLELLAYDVVTGAGKGILVDAIKPWVNLHDDLWIVDATGEFTWSSERSGYRHLSLHRPDGSLIRPLTSGEWLVEATIALDQQRRQLYFLGWRETPLERQLFRVSLDGGEAEQLTREDGTHAAVIAPDFSTFVEIADDRMTPPEITVRATSGAVRHSLHKPATIDLELAPPELHSFRTGDGTELYAAVYRPPRSEKAPVIVSVYGGPGPQTVSDSWIETVDLRAQMLAERGFIVLKVDNRGSARRGLKFEAPIAHHMGGIELKDQVEGVRWLGTQGDADLTRVGIYGWSYGGYMTLMCMLRAPDLFKVGVAGAPVTDMAGYDTAYTERYMGTPAENPDGYRDSSVLTHADALRGKLLVIHGMIDENVHFRHTARLMQALIDAGKPFDTLLYPNERHMPRSEPDRADMERRVLEYFERHL